jgi:hypothetical protein
VKEEIKELVDKGLVKEVGMGPVKEVGMGPVKKVDIRERQADGRELLSGPSSLTIW